MYYMFVGRQIDMDMFLYMYMYLYMYAGMSTVSFLGPGALSSPPG